MAQERSFNPEKQLLGLIEGQKTKSTDIRAKAIKHYGLGLFSVDVWLGRLSYFKDKLERWFSGEGRKAFDINVINNILVVVIIILFVYFIGNLAVSVINMKKTPNYLKSAIQKEISSPSGVYDASGVSRSVSYYLEKVRQRDIFRMGSKGASGADKTVKAPSQRITEATQSLKLVGISWSNDPDALIEDTKALRTFFVKRSQMIGEIRVQAIFKDRVILYLDGEEIELK